MEAGILCGCEQLQSGQLLQSCEPAQLLRLLKRARFDGQPHQLCAGCAGCDGILCHVPAGEAEIAQLGQLHNGGCYAGKQVAVQLKLGEAGGVRQRSNQLLAWLSHRERVQLRQLDVVQHLCLLLAAFSVNAQRGHQAAHTLQQALGPARLRGRQVVQSG